MSIYTITGIIIALIGVIFTSPDILFGYGGIFRDTEKQAEYQYEIEYARFAGDEKHKEKMKKSYMRSIRIYKMMRFSGLLLLIIGFSLQIVGQC